MLPMDQLHIERTAGSTPEVSILTLTGPLTIATLFDLQTALRAPDLKNTILDFAARWVEGDPVAASDVTAAVWAKMDALEPYGLWSEAHRIIAIAGRLVG